MDISKDIQPMTTFRNNSAEIMRHLRETGRPVVRTVNGKTVAVIQDAAAYQHLLDLAAQADASARASTTSPKVSHGQRVMSSRTCPPNMTYRVDLTRRAERDLRRLYQDNARHSGAASDWFNGLERLIATLDQFPERGGITPEDPRLRQLLYGQRPRAYRVIYAIDNAQRMVRVVHIRHGASRYDAPPPLTRTAPA